VRPKTPALVLATFTIALISPLVSTSIAASGANVLSVEHATTWTTTLLASGPTSFQDISCPAPQVCTAVGGGATDSGAIFRTTNGGLTWTRQNAPSRTADLNAVDCPTTEFCFAEYISGGGYAEPIWSSFIETRDGGAEWTSSSGTPEIAEGSPPACAGPTRCFVAELGYPVSRTTDGGNTWKKLSMAGWDSIDHVTCARASSCFVIGTVGPSKHLEFGTIVGYGARIRLVGAVPSLAGFQPSKLVCASARSCAVSGTASNRVQVLTTSDGGSMWQIRELPASVQTATSISCATFKYCVVSGTTQPQPGHLLSATTNDDGRTWTVATVSPDIGGDLSCPTTGTCYLAGGGITNDTVLVRALHATRWTADVIHAGPSPLSAVTCSTAITCLVVGYGTALRSLDDGATWTSISPAPNVAAPLGALTCPTASVCLAGGAGVLYRSMDAGTTWSTTPLPTADVISTIACATTTTCLATTAAPNTLSAAPILRTTDAGLTWDAYANLDAPIDAVSCGSPTDCVAVAWTGKTYTTSNGGASWAQSNLISAKYGVVALGSVSCTSAAVCFASGAEPQPGNPYLFSQMGVYASNDGGVTWTLDGTPSSSGYGRIACNGSVCQVVGLAYGTLSTSVDGGSTWSNVKLPDAPTVAGDVASTSSGGWILVGGDSLNGALVATGS
jgi:photosystem II stability/assembly factor-like uncharacterized protein